MSKLLRPDLVTLLQKLAVSPFRPPEILALQAEIDGEMRALTVREALLGTVDEEALTRAAVVVQKKFRLDGLYTAWAARELAAADTVEQTN